jgi:hypothetical protein
VGWAVIETEDGNVREIATVPQIWLKNTDPKGVFFGHNQRMFQR